MPNDGHGSDDQHLAQVAVACSRYSSEPLLAPAGVLSWHKPDPGSQITAGPEDRRIGDACDEGAGKQRAHPGDLHQPTADLSLTRALADAAVVLEDLLLHDDELRHQHLKAYPSIVGNARILRIRDDGQQPFEPKPPNRSDDAE